MTRGQMFRIVCVLFLAGCTADPRANTSEDSSSSGAPSLTLADSPLAVIGASGAREGEQLFQVVSAFQQSNGTVVIANAGTRELRFFDNAGRHVRAIGREGAGPGEFRFLRSAARLRGDSIATWDPPQRRVTFFNPEGAVVATQELGRAFEVELSGTSVMGVPSVAWFLADGRAVIELGFPTAVMSRGPNGVRRDTIPLFIVARDGSVLARIGPIPGGETLVHDGSSIPLPLGHRLLVAAGHGEIYVGDGKSPIQVFDSVGHRIRAIEIETRPAAVSDAEFAAVKDRILGNVVASARTSVEGMLSTMSKPEFRPRYARLLVARGGRLWIERYRVPADSVQRWLVVQPDGQPVSHVALPALYQVLDATPDHILVLLRDQLDVEQVRVYALRPVRSRAREEPLTTAPNTLFHAAAARVRGLAAPGGSTQVGR